MKIAFITTKPVRLESGTEVRNYYLLKSLSESKEVTSIDLIYINSNIHDTDIALKDPKLHVELFNLPKRSSVSSLLSYIRGHVPYHDHLQHNCYTHEILRIIESSEWIILSELDAFVASKVALSLLKRGNVLLDCHNVDYIRFASEVGAGSPIKKLLGSLLIPTFKRTERDALKNANLITCCSTHDKTLLTTFADSAKIHVLPNGANLVKPITAKNSHQKISAPNILFIGLLSFGPNEDGIRYYLEQIHPTIISKYPNTKLVIIGKHAPDWLLLKASQDPSIHIEGFVPLLDPYLNEADVCICPLRYGSGTRLKILEYFAASKAVVSSSIGSEGIDVTDRKNILLADTPHEFSDAITSILEDSALSKSLSIGARELVEMKYNWESIGNVFIALLAKNLEGDENTHSQ